MRAVNNGNGALGRGIVSSFKETISSAIHAISNPIETIKAAGKAILNPIETVKSIGNGIAAEFKSNPSEAGGKAFGFALQAAIGGGVLNSTSKGAKVVTSTEAAPAGVQSVYRVFGGEAQALGRSWTPINPNTVSNYRDAAGLPNWTICDRRNR